MVELKRLGVKEGPCHILKSGGPGICGQHVCCGFLLRFGKVRVHGPMKGDNLRLLGGGAFCQLRIYNAKDIFGRSPIKQRFRGGGGGNSDPANSMAGPKVLNQCQSNGCRFGQNQGVFKLKPRRVIAPKLGGNGPRRGRVCVHQSRDRIAILGKGRIGPGQGNGYRFFLPLDLDRSL